MTGFILVAIFAGAFGYLIGQTFGKEKKVFYLNIYKRGDLYYSKSLWESPREAEFESSGEPDFIKTITIIL